jgi:hypothetical protein
MALCTDRSITFLNAGGYNVVRVPRSGIEPLDVITRDGKICERLGRLDQLWTSTDAVPPAGPPRAAADIEGQTTGELKLSIGLRFLASTLGAMGARIPDLGFAYTRAETVHFQFANVRSAAVDPLVVGDFLQHGDLHAGNPFVERYFLDEDAEAFVITEVLKSDQLLVIGKTDSGTELSVDVAGIQQLLGGTVAVSASNAAQTQVTYKGSEFLTFAFKAFSIGFRDGRWHVDGVASNVGLNVAGGVATDAPAVLRHGTILVR